MLVGFTVPEYSSISEHMSKLGLLGGYPAFFEKALGVIAGVSITVFSLALIRHPLGRFSFTAFTSVMFGINMLSNGIFPMGSPLHGLYGIGFFALLTPAYLPLKCTQANKSKPFPSSPNGLPSLYPAIGSKAVRQSFRGVPDSSEAVHYSSEAVPDWSRAVQHYSKAVPDGSKGVGDGLRGLADGFRVRR